MISLPLIVVSIVAGLASGSGIRGSDAPTWSKYVILVGFTLIVVDNIVRRNRTTVERWKTR